MNRQIELAKSILEANGYSVIKNPLAMKRTPITERRQPGQEPYRFEVAFKDPDATYHNFIRAAAGFSGDMTLSAPVNTGHKTYVDTDDVVAEIFDQAGNVYSFKVVEDVVSAIDRVLTGWEYGMYDESDEFIELYHTALAKFDYVLKTNFSSKYKIELE